MAIFLDTGFFLGLCHPLDPNHESAVNIFRRMSTGEFGMIYTSPFIINETATLIMVRTDNNHILLDRFFSYTNGDECFVEVLPWKADFEPKIKKLFLKSNQEGIPKKQWRSYTDVSNIIYCQEYHIDKIAAFDSHFEAFLAWIH